MAAQKIIVVVGATGNQGGSVARTFLALPDWHVRAVTRNSASDAAVALREAGAEIFQADLQKPETLQAAFAGAEAIFLNTDFWGTYRPLMAKLQGQGQNVEPASRVAWEHETKVGKNAVQAAAAVPGLRRFVYTALPSPARNSGGKYTRSLHAESKTDIVEYIEREQPQLAAKTSILYPGAYNSNRMLLAPKPHPETGVLQFTFSLSRDVEMPLIDEKLSLGKFVRQLIEREEPGTKLLAYDSNLTIGQIVDTWEKVSGRKIEYAYQSCQTMHDKFNVPWEFLDMIEACEEYGYAESLQDAIMPAQLKDKVDVTSYEEWLMASGWEKRLPA